MMLPARHAVDRERTGKAFSLDTIIWIVVYPATVRGPPTAMAHKAAVARWLAVDERACHKQYKHLHGSVVVV